MTLFNNYQKHNCDCNYTPLYPDQVDESCSLNSIRETLLEIIKLFKQMNDPSLIVTLNITTESGIVHTITISQTTINSIKLTETTLIINSLAISLCNITKINISSNNTTFNTLLSTAIKNIAKNEPYQKNNSYCDCCEPCNSCSTKDVKCAQGIQNHINQNINQLGTVSYNGSFEEIEALTALSDIEDVDVLKTATLTTTDTPVLKTATIKTEAESGLKTATLTTTNTPILKTAELEAKTTPVIKTVTPADTSIVSDVELENLQVVSSASPEIVEVSLPIKTTPKSVVSDVITSESSIITKVDTTNKNVITKVTPETAFAVTGFEEGKIIKGAISNVDNIKNIKPIPVKIPTFSTDEIGKLQVLIPANSIDGNNPSEDKYFDIQVSTKDLEITNYTTYYVLPDGTSVLGGSTQNPKLVDLTECCNPKTAPFVNAIKTENADVIETVIPTTSPSLLVKEVDKVDINTVEIPSSTSVIKSLNENSKNINTVTKVDKTPISELIKTTTADVVNSVTLKGETSNVIDSVSLNTTTQDFLRSATLETTTSDVLDSSTLNTSPETVVKDIETSSQTVYSPSEENINGDIFVAGDGIMGINNADGSISVYSICDINKIS